MQLELGEYIGVVLLSTDVVAIFVSKAYKIKDVEKWDFNNERDFTVEICLKVLKRSFW